MSYLISQVHPGDFSVEFYAYAHFFITQHTQLLVHITGLWHIKKRTFSYHCVGEPQQLSNHQSSSFIEDLVAELREKSQIPVSSQDTAFTIETRVDAIHDHGELVYNGCLNM